MPAHSLTSYYYLPIPQIRAVTLFLYGCALAQVTLLDFVSSFASFAEAAEELFVFQMVIDSFRSVSPC